MTNVNISILIYRGEPLDYSQYRHTALWLQFADKSPSLMAHVTGPIGEFTFECKVNLNPWVSGKYAKMVDVGLLSVNATAAQTVAALQRVNINNRDPEFNCQTWVEYALKMFKDAGHLSKELYDQGVEGMVDAIAEAKDTEE